MVCVTPVLFSGAIKANSTTISFLGSILERVVAVPEKSVQDLDATYFIKYIEDIATKGLDIVELKHPESIIKPPYSDLNKGEFLSYGYNKEKSTPALHLENKYKRNIEVGNISVAGAAKNRMLLYQPDLPKLIFLNPGFNFGNEVIIKFRISKDGFVENLECIISSGVPDIDEAAVRYLRRWQFVPEEESDSVGEGMVRLVFN
jgi:TonB family protein